MAARVPRAHARRARSRNAASRAALVLVHAAAVRGFCGTGPLHACRPTAITARAPARLPRALRTELHALDVAAAAATGDAAHARLAGRSLALAPNEVDEAALSTAEAGRAPAERLSRQTLACRALPAAAAALHLARPGVLDGATAGLWRWLFARSWAHHMLFEGWVASAGFFASIVGFSALHLFMRDSASHRLGGRAPTRNFEWATPAGLHKALPLPVYMLSIRLFHVFKTKPPLPAAAPLFATLALEVAAGVVLYDLAFYFVHRTFHSRRSSRRWRRLHGRHHLTPPPDLAPVDTVQHSYVDGAMQVAVNVLVQLWSPLSGWGGKHPMSRCLHNLVVTYLLTEAHSGFDLPWMSHRVWPRVFGGAPAHERHHKVGTSDYQQFFRYLKPLE